MILIDANLLLYAYDAASPHQPKARAWLEDVFSGPQPVGLAWTSLLAFLRIGTHTGVFDQPFSIREAVDRVDEWFAQPAVRLLEPTERHWPILRDLLPESQTTGALVTDAHFAALAIEHGAVLCTTDRDFSRFEGLRTLDPLAD